MTAYGAVISLTNTIHHILHSSHLSLVRPSLKNTLYHIYCSCCLNLVPSSLEILQVAYEELQPLQEILERLDESRKSKSRKKVNALDGQIKETLWKFEDLLESLVSHQISLQSGEAEIERDVLKLYSIDLQSLQDEADSFIQTLKVMENEYIYEVGNMPEDEDEDEDEDESCISSSTSSAAGYGGTKSKMIGLSDRFEKLKSYLLDDRWRLKTFDLLAILGMAGIGKTTLVRKIYEDPQIMSHFDCRLWITVGRKTSSRLSNQLEVSRSILAELKGDEKCLIVFDDVWETHEFSSLLTFIQEMNTYVRILVSSRDQTIIKYKHVSVGYMEEVRFLNEEESKDLLCHKVFGENIICPYQLDKAATKIAKNCEGLPLTIVTVADILSKSQNRDPQYWEDVAEERNSVFSDAYTAMSKVLFPTYDYLNQRFKMPFLFMGRFPRNYEIPPSKIINMLKAEGWFLDPHKQGHYASEESIRDCLKDLCTSLYLVLLKPKSGMIFTYIKTCRLHSAWRQLCRGEARKKKFFHVLNRIGDASEQEIIQGQRGLCLENNLLFGIKEFCNSVRLNCASYTRSLLFFGPYHQYPTPIDAIGFKLLRELDALQLRFYTFPSEILTLVLLKYLALTCNGQLPSTISKLFNLKVLIVHPHMSITKCHDTAPSSSSVPIEILLNMEELEHIETLGKSFLAPPNDHVVASLKKVSTVVGVNAASICTITKRSPYIKKLGVQMELMPYDDVDYCSDVILSCFPHISTLEGLETLKCSIINPALHVMPSPRSLVFPYRLRKLHLSGTGFPWEYMDVIGYLPSLEVLKLRSYAFRGSLWKTKEGSFLCLIYLVIEDSDLVEWKPRYGSFRSLRYLSLKHCYKLQKLKWPSDAIVGKIELVNCNPLGVTCAKKLFQRKDPDWFSVTATDDY